MLSKRKIVCTINLSNTIPQGNNNNTLIFEAAQAKGFARIDFEVKKYASISSFGLSTANIEIYNISDEHANSIAKRGLTVALDAGYEDEYLWGGRISNIFLGKISSVIRTKKSPDSSDIITTLACVNSLPQQTELVYSNTIRKLKLTDALQKICNYFSMAASFQQGTFNDFSGDVVNQAIKGNLSEVLSELAIQYNFDYSFEGNTVVFSKRVAPPTVTISPDNGLMGLPEITEKGVDLKVFLNPQLYGGTVFTLSSKYSTFKLGAIEFLDRIRGNEIHTFVRKLNSGRYEGDYRIISLLHRGSSHDNTWETQLECMMRNDQLFQKVNL